MKQRDWQWSYAAPYLLDTAEKVKWANARLAQGYQYMLGDSCPIRPKDEQSEVTK